MEIVSIEARTYEAMMECFEHFTRSVDALCERHGDKELKKWLDNQDVCQILNISKRTLQTLRDSGKLSYSLIGSKAFYKKEDVQTFIEKNLEGKEVNNGR